MVLQARLTCLRLFSCLGSQVSGEKTVCNSISWFWRYFISREIREFLRFFSYPVALIRRKESTCLSSWLVSEVSIVGVIGVSIRCLGDVWQVSGSGLEGVRKGSGMCQIFWTSLDNSLIPFLTSILHNKSYKLHLTPCIINIASYAFYLKQSMLCKASCILCLTHSILHISSYAWHFTHWIVHIALDFILDIRLQAHKASDTFWAAFAAKKEIW